MERPAGHQQLQETNPPHCREPSTGRWPECVLLQVWKTHFYTPLRPPHTSSTSCHTPVSPCWHPTYTRTYEEDVSQFIRRKNTKKASGSYSMSPSCLKVCADQWVPSLHRSSTDHWSSCFRCSTIISVPKKPCMTGLNDYRPVSLTSVVMKSFAKGPLQFAYWANRSADDIVNMELHYILQHLFT